MNYEFYFLRDTGLRQPEILRVIAPTFDDAAAVVARQYGWASPFRNRRQVTETEFIHSMAIRPIEVQNIFETGLPSTSPAT